MRLSSQYSQRLRLAFLILLGMMASFSAGYAQNATPSADSTLKGDSSNGRLKADEDNGGLSGDMEDSTVKEKAPPPPTAITKTPLPPDNTGAAPAHIN